MILIEKGTDNNICVTLTESATLVNPFYLFKFIKDDSQDEILFATSDLSPYKNRYNLFELTESDEGSTTGGVEVSLKLIKGQYTYYVYQTSELTIDEDLIVGDFLECGRMLVTGDITGGIYE